MPIGATIAIGSPRRASIPDAVGLSSIRMGSLRGDPATSPSPSAHRNVAVCSAIAVSRGSA
jgi:hypothetical protein